MTVDLTILISVCVAAFTILGVVYTITKSKRDEICSTTSEMTTVIVKLEHISDAVTGLRGDISGVKEDIKDVRERLIKTEESAKAAHHRLDTLERMYNDTVNKQGGD